MRDIKFRGKRIDNIKNESREFVYGSYLYINNYDYNWNGTKSANKSEAYFIVDEKDNNILIDKNTIGQYIGIKDKNGKEIYEGDIVSDKYGNIGYIEYNKNKFEIIGLEYYQELEVIGNIYENKDLFVKDINKRIEKNKYVSELMSMIEKEMNKE